MKKIGFIFMLLVSWTSFSQVQLTGVVKDSIGTPLEMANVIALDTVAKRIVSFGFTDAKGNFKLDLKRNTTYNVKISYIGYSEISQFVKTKESNQSFNFTMNEDKMLEGISIVSKMPVIVKGDTIIYNADSFKNGSERKLEDVLKKLPGVEINDAGEIEVEGKAVEKITVDGKDFFSGDTKLASKNIPSNAVDKIQVLRNYSSVNQLSGVQNNQDRVAINIKLKEGKKNFWFGDVLAGAGSTPNESLYLFQPKLFYYTPKYTLNVIGDVNNLGEVVLGRNDLRGFSGGFVSESPSNGTNINLASAGIGFLSANTRNANRIETKLSALNFSYSPNPKLDLSGFLIWSSNKNGQKNRNLIDYTNPNIPDDVTESTTDQTSNTGLVKLGSIYRKNINNQMNYDFIGRFSNEFRTDNTSSQVVGNNIIEKENATPFRINQNLSYFYTATEKSIFALEVQHLFQDEDPFYAASLENNPSSDQDGFDPVAEELGFETNVQQYLFNQDRSVKSNQLDAKLDYYYILNQKSNLNFVGGSILSKQNFDSRFYQILDNNSEFEPNPTIPGIANTNTANDTEYNFTDIYAGLRYRLKTGIFTFTPGFTAHAYSINNTQFGGSKMYEDSFYKFLPEFETIAQFKRSESLTFRYKQEVNFTDVNQLAEGLVANSYNNFFYGNNNLMNGTNQSTSLNYSNFNLYNGTSMFALLRHTKSIDQIGSIANFIPGSNVSTRTNQNLPFDTESILAIASFSKTFKKIRTKISGNYNKNRSYQFFGDNQNKIQTNSYSIRPSINTNFTKAPNITLRYNMSFNDQDITSLLNSTTTNFKSATIAPSISFDAYIWNSLTIRTDYKYTEVRQEGEVQNSFDVLNFTMGYRKDRDAKWEYELEGSNLLGTDSLTSVNIGNISNNIRETFVLPRLISLRVRYQL